MCAASSLEVMDIDMELTLKFSCLATAGTNFLVFKMQRLPGFRLNLAGCSSCT